MASYDKTAILDCLIPIIDLGHLNTTWQGSCLRPDSIRLYRPFVIHKFPDRVLHIMTPTDPFLIEYRSLLLPPTFLADPSQAPMRRSSL